MGMVTESTITRLMDFGAFAELSPGVEGLIHISELATHRVTHTGQVVKPGDKIKVKVLAVDLEKKRISLSAAQVQREAAQQNAQPADSSAGSNAGSSPASSPAAPAKPAGKAAKKIVLRGGL